MIAVITEREELVFEKAVASVIEDGCLLLFKDRDATQVVAGFSPGAWSQFHFG